MRRYFMCYVMSALVLILMETRDLSGADTLTISSRPPAVAEVSCTILGINTENKPIVRCVSKPA